MSLSLVCRYIIKAGCVFRVPRLYNIVACSMSSLQSVGISVVLEMGIGILQLRYRQMRNGILLKEL